MYISSVRYSANVQYNIHLLYIFINSYSIDAVDQQRHGPFRSDRAQHAFDLF